jgi:hypothetical protein
MLKSPMHPSEETQRFANMSKDNQYETSGAEELK